jgi:hypothetical protein
MHIVTVGAALGLLLGRGHLGGGDLHRRHKHIVQSRCVDHAVDPLGSRPARIDQGAFSLELHYFRLAWLSLDVCLSVACGNNDQGIVPIAGLGSGLRYRFGKC